MERGWKSESLKDVITEKESELKTQNQQFSHGEGPADSAVTFCLKLVFLLLVFRLILSNGYIFSCDFEHLPYFTYKIHQNTKISYSKQLFKSSNNSINHTEQVISACFVAT